MSDTFTMRGDRVFNRNFKHSKTLYLSTEIMRGLDAYGKGQQSQIVEDALISFWKLNPKTPRGQTISLTIIEAPKETETARCEVKGCKFGAVSSGVFKEKEYRLCEVHVKQYVGVVGWLIK